MILWGTQIVLFGGRNSEIQKRHVPMTYRLSSDNSTDREFESYSERVYDCETLLRERRFAQDPSAKLEDVNCSADTLGEQITASYIWNDVWMYDLNCSRDWNEGCSRPSHWEVLHEGAINGGCKNYVGSAGKEICTVPR